MKVNRSVEHAVLAVLMMAVQADHSPVKSHTLSRVMGVSDSYLKKTLRKLAVAGIVDSVASKEGGYMLARSVDQISLADVYNAIEPEGFSFRSSPLAEVVFPEGGAHVQESADKVGAFFQEGYAAFLDKLGTCMLADLLEPGVWEKGAIDWTDRVDS